MRDKYTRLVQKHRKQHILNCVCMFYKR